MIFEQGHDPRRNTGGRPKGTKNKRTLIREALNAEFNDGELGFWKAAAQQAKEGDSQVMALIANRLIPALKSEIQSVEIDLPEGNAVAVAVAQSLVVSAANGDLSPDQLGSLISSLATVLKIEEATLLEERVSILEAKR